MPKSQDNHGELSKIMNAIADSVAECSPDVLWEECTEEGLKVDAIADRTRSVILGAIKKHKQRKLHEAKRAYLADISSRQVKQYRIPSSAEKRKQLLDFAFTKIQQLQGPLSAAARELDSLTDEDIQRMLEGLQELGVLDENDVNKFPG